MRVLMNALQFAFDFERFVNFKLYRAYMIGRWFYFTLKLREVACIVQPPLDRPVIAEHKLY